MKRSPWLPAILLTVLGFVGPVQTAQAVITPTDDVSPALPWNSSTIGYVGKTEDGTLTVDAHDADSHLSSSDAYIGHRIGTTGLVTIDGTNATWENRNLYIGNAGSGTLNITDGGSVSNNWGTIGSGSGSTGLVNVEGIGSAWTTSNVDVGYRGNGTLNITSGAVVTLTGYTASWIGHEPNSTGVLTVTGPGSKWLPRNDLHVGHEGNGTLTIRDGGDVTVGYSSRDAYVGYESGSTGKLTVTGTGSKLPNYEELYVGNSGMGTLEIDDGGTVSNEYGHIGYHSGSTGKATVDGVDSTWNATYLYVGNSGNGTFGITGGGTVDSSSGFIGDQAGSTGEATVDGAGSQWTSYGLYVGNSGSGILNITNGSAVAVSNATYVARNAGSTGATGAINFGDNGGTLTTNMLWGGASQITGTGTINTKSLVSDVDLIFDSTHGLSQTFTLARQPGQNITFSIDLSDPANVADFGVGYSDSGSMTIRDGVAIHSENGYLGYGPGSTGSATVTGDGAIWNNGDRFYIGVEGNGQLNVTNRATVTSKFGYIGSEIDSVGMVTVHGEGSAWNNSLSFSVGYDGHGALAITSGGTVTSGSGCYYKNYVGHHSSSTGIVTVDGNGSTWNANCGLYLGVEGNGILNVSHGGSVNVAKGDCYIGEDAGSIGQFSVNGIGSTFINERRLYVGHDSGGIGVLNIVGGGAVSTQSVLIENEGGLISIAVAGGSSFSVSGGDGALTNNGIIRILAGANPTANDIYTPIVAGTWTGTGTCQSLGGTWDNASKQFTVSPVISQSANHSASINLTQKQRLSFLDTTTGQHLGVSFDPTSTTTLGGSTITFTASKTDLATQDGLTALLDPSESILGSWDISTDLAEGELAYLSMEVDPGWESMTVWHYDGIDWTEYELPDYSILSGDGAYANFLVDGFSSYAVTGAPVPEPSMVVLLLSVVSIGMLVLRKRA